MSASACECRSVLVVAVPQRPYRRRKCRLVRSTPTLLRFRMALISTVSCSESLCTDRPVSSVSPCRDNSFGTTRNSIVFSGMVISGLVTN